LIPCLTNIGKFSIWFQRPKFFNSVSREIQNNEGFGLCLVVPQAQKNSDFFFWVEGVAVHWLWKLRFVWQKIKKNNSFLVTNTLCCCNFFIATTSIDIHIVVYTYSKIKSNKKSYKIFDFKSRDSTFYASYILSMQ